MISPDGENAFTFGDCAVIPEPDSRQLAEIAAESAVFHQLLTREEPIVAFLSFSTKGSANHYRVDKVRDAVEIFGYKFPQIIHDGELQVDAAIIPEPMNNALVRTNVGVIWFRVHVKGRPVHVAAASSGANAIDAAMYLITTLKEFEAQRNSRKTDYPHFVDLQKPINVNVGKIEGGDWASTVPAWCSFDVRTALYPGEDAHDGAREIEDFIRKASGNHPFLSNNPPEVEFNGFMAEGYELQDGTQAELMLREAHKSVFQNDLNAVTSLAYLDGRVFVLYDDIPCLVYGPMAENIHGFDERVSITSVEKVTATIALYIAMWCGLEKI